MAFDVSARVSRSRAAIERAQEKANKSKSQQHGRYYVVEPRVIGGGELPTKDEWMEEQIKKSGNKQVKPSERPEPTIIQGRK